MMTMTYVQGRAWRRTLCVAGCIGVGVILQQCASQPAPPAQPAKDAWVADVKPTLTIRELMTHFIDPTADFVFDAVVYDSSASGTNETVPISDDDWAKVERGAWQLAESANLLMIPRQAEPAGTSAQPLRPGERAPELSGPEIDEKIAADRARWNQHADALRVASLKAIEMVKSRNPDAILNAGTEIDNACESCHLEYWYPGDRPAVLADQQKKVTYDPPKK
jgi:cytochrome c556